jgi:sugar lactone lactonase YvrE
VFAVIVGTGEYRYELVEGWEKLPDGMSHPDVAAVRYCPDTGHVFVFNRSADPVLRFTTAGELVDAWGGEYFPDTRGPHGMHLPGDGTMLLADTRRDSVERYRYNGERLGSIPASQLPVGQSPFDKPTGALVHPNGSTYITDGYGNSFLHRYDAAGGREATWGRPGQGPLEFAIPHGIALAPDGNLLVADRENHRIQVISPGGEYLGEIRGLFRPCAIQVAEDGTMFIPELGADTTGPLAGRPVPSRVTVLAPDGSVAARWGDHDGLPAGNFVAAHDICLDDEGSVYVAEVTQTMGVSRGLVPPGTHTLQKFARR